MQASSDLEALIRRAYFGMAFVYHSDLRSLYTFHFYFCHSCFLEPYWVLQTGLESEMNV